MKQKNSLLTLVVLTVLTVGYLAYDFWSEKHSADQEANEALLLKLNKDQINEFEIERFGPAGVSEKIIAKSTPDGWDLVQPLKDIADQGATSDFVEAATLERSQKIVREGEGIDWKIYGLDQPKGKVTFRTNDGKSVSFDISTMKNYMADVYLRKGGENKVFLASSTWTARIDKQAYDFRDKRLMRNSYAAVDQIQLTSGKENFLLKKADGKWQSKEKPDWHLDQTKAGELSSMLSTTNILEFSKEGDISAEDLKKFGLQLPKAKIELTLNNAKKWQASFYQNSKKDYYILTSEPQRLVKISMTDGEKIATKTLASLRNTREPFDFRKDQGQKLRVYQNSKPEVFSSDKADNIIRALRNLEVKDFEVKNTPSQLQDFVEVIDQDQKLVFKMSTAKIGKLVAVKTNLVDNIVALDESQIQKLGIDKLFEKEVDQKHE